MEMLQALLKLLQAPLKLVKAPIPAPLELLEAPLELLHAPLKFFQIRHSLVLICQICLHEYIQTFIRECVRV